MNCTSVLPQISNSCENIVAYDEYRFKEAQLKQIIAMVAKDYPNCDVEAIHVEDTIQIRVTPTKRLADDFI
jgi:hypothetical protein